MVSSIIFLHPGEAKAGLYPRFRVLDPRANSREPPQTRILTQIFELIRIQLLFILPGLPQNAIQKR